MTRLRESIKGKVYGNYSVYSPNDTLMFKSNLKKINWYLSRGLATIIDDTKIRLNFEPNGMGLHGRSYGLGEMIDQCVVCGSNANLTKHHVVPKCYRIHFEEEIKSHQFHDVLTVCVGCHYKYEEKAFSYKKELADIYDSPINGSVISNNRKLKIRGLIDCLSNDNIPKDRISEIRNEIKKELGITRLTNKELGKYSRPEPITLCVKTHGEMVVSKISDIMSFIIDWRHHFVKNANPQYLPKNWSIYYNEKTTSNIV